MKDPMEIARRHDDAWNTKNVDERRACCASDVELEMPGGMNVRGVDQFLQIESAFWEALPDSQIKRTSELLAGDTVIAEGFLTGTQTGPFRTPQGEVPPSGNTVTLRLVSLKRIVDGKITSERLYFDQMEFMAQLGMLPPAT